MSSEQVKMGAEILFFAPSLATSPPAVKEANDRRRSRRSACRVTLLELSSSKQKKNCKKNFLFKPNKPVGVLSLDSSPFNDELPARRNLSVGLFF